MPEVNIRFSMKLLKKRRGEKIDFQNRKSEELNNFRIDYM
jgi:hypothetical protein